MTSVSFESSISHSFRKWSTIKSNRGIIFNSNKSYSLAYSQSRLDCCFSPYNFNTSAAATSRRSFLPPKTNLKYSNQTRLQSYNHIKPIASHAANLNKISPLALSSVSFHSSTPAEVTISGFESPSEPPEDVLNFDEVAQSFASKSNFEIIRALFVFRMCSIKFFVVNGERLLRISEAIIGRKLTDWILGQTFFGHFCAGCSADEIQPKILQLAHSGIGSILDYAAEADVSQDQKRPDVPSLMRHPGTGIVSARTYDYEGESECDANMQLSLNSIDAAGRQGGEAQPLDTTPIIDDMSPRGDGGGFVAIKVTALGKPELLERMSACLVATKRMFTMFYNQTLIPDIRRNPHINLDKNQLTYEMFEKGLRAIKVDLQHDSIRELFDRIDTDKSGTIDWIEWVVFLDPRELGGLTPKFKSEGLPTLSASDLEKSNAMIKRLETLADRAAQRKVRLMIDAEQTYLQPAIDHLVLHLQRQYNRKLPLIYNTYQCYLRDSLSRVKVDLARAKREGFYFACKAVRGAYMIQERKRAHDMDYEDPIHSCIQDTHASYHQVVTLLLDNISRADVMVASHNEDSIKLVTKLMKQRQLAKKGSGVYFGQLLGMCDHVSFSLGHHGYAVYKYTPWGPIHETIPYLLRRAHENSDLLGGATKERKLLFNEIVRRMFPPAAKDPKIIDQSTPISSNVQPPVTHSQKTTNKSI